ncbi:hypothetical protein [Paradevosia shaoguanensis]|uniref:hypothetical protein n=1 Tax=Paradevosia shaoguanensis TaxID=1335043 RepID=UPI0019328328|nr:hypothetical protein [Paradevosia shaoguanensis]
MYIWASAFLWLGIVLLAIGVVPALAFAFFLPQADPLVPALLSLTVAPLGAVMLLIGIILYLVVAFQRRR